MAAVIQLPTHQPTAVAAPVAEFFALAQPVPEVEVAPRPQLRVIEGGRVAALRVRRPAVVYRRRRLGVLLAFAALVAVSLTMTWSMAGGDQVTADTGSEPVPVVAPAASSSDAPGDSYIVQPGDTIWSIAEQVAGGGDVRVVVDRLAEAAGSPVLQVGQRLDLRAVTGG